jgi:hypothetical protein
MRGSSEKVGRSLRLTKEHKAREEAIKEFERAISELQVTSAEELLISIMQMCYMQFLSEPSHPNPSLFTPNLQTPVSPVMPLPKDSSKGKSSDKFEVHNEPRNLLPGAFINTPKCAPLSSTSILSSLTTLSSSSTHSQNAMVT